MCEGPTWVYPDSIVYNSAGELVFGGPSIIQGNFTFVSTDHNWLTFGYTAFLRVYGHARIDQGSHIDIKLSVREAQDLWTHRDRNVTYLQADVLDFNNSLVSTINPDACTRIAGVSRVDNTNSSGVISQLLVVEFTDFNSYATCKIWWVIPLVIVCALAIISIGIFCYFRGRNKQQEEAGYIPVVDPLHPGDTVDPETQKLIN